MAARLIDGKKIAADIKRVLKKEVAELKAKGVEPCLAVVFDGTDPTSRKYVALKIKACEEVGINILIYTILKSTTQKDIVKFVQRLNSNQKVNGIFIQLPLRDGLDKNIINSISPEKDVDGCVPLILAKVGFDKPHFIPCALYGVIKMLEAYEIKLDGKHAVIVGNSQMGNNEKFLTFLLSKKNATVTTCSSKESNLKEKCLKADILCVAAGRAKMITADMVKNCLLLNHTTT
jgi:methylenetetrahydrofolate dehydrogenase (NADP+)/methenyltetrahydrofolate cyclohydrolase